MNKLSDSISEKFDTEDIDKLNSDEQFKKLLAQRFGYDTVDRKWLAKWTAAIVSLWLIAVLLIIVFNNTLSDTVLITLLGTTTLNVLGLSFIVLRGHFNSTK